MDFKDYQAGVSKSFFWFRAKDRLIDVLLSKLKSKKRMNILNVGAGTGDDLAIISKYGDTYVMDIDSNALDLIPQELIVDKKVCDICSISYPDNFFDIVVAFGVLEHIEDDVQAVKEIYRVLKPSGNFVFYVPAFNFLFSAHDRALNTFRRYTKRTLQDRLLPFKRIELGYWMFILFLPFALERILKRSVKTTEVHFPKLPGLVNSTFYFVMCCENWLIKRNIRPPFGTIIYGICRK
jgi:ubiquinone/menaquinone biosynthesis C-methylase UbiE